MLGSAYVLTLNAQDCVEGKVLAEEQVQAARRKPCWRRWAAAVSAFREKLGESLASIQRYDAKIEEATHAVARSAQGLQPGPAHAAHQRRFRFGAVLPARHRARSGVRARVRAAGHGLLQPRPGARSAQDDDAGLRAARQGQRGRAALHRGALLHDRAAGRAEGARRLQRLARDVSERLHRADQFRAAAQAAGRDRPRRCGNSKLATQVAPDQPLGWTNLGQYLFRTSSRFDEARRRIETAIKLQDSTWGTHRSVS